MKIFQSFNVFATTFAMIFIAGSVKSCEKDCRAGISNAFADSWSNEVKPIFENFKKNATSNLFYGISFDKISSDPNVINKITKELINSVSGQCDNFTSEYIYEMPGVIQNAIFNEEPKFMGDCNNPKRVTQPPKGVNWTMDDCVKMDYVCGNPPSICHFFDVNKNKSFVDLDQKIANYSAPGGVYITAIKNNVTAIATNYNLTSDGANHLETCISTNFQSWLNVFPASFSSAFCPDMCPKYDTNIKLLLLSYP
ncbi:Phosphoenolpyruvate carboxykinase ATP [Gigaspora margarita]|uniref:Phosphoenolpyruvate carboxykinase ATP n=1 Tax=Gigaspora margarita TaxID=4874 RepID=A0A8H4B0X9_GIGMA|nr:Phosphoenolpyruvate carboxykinase ATP [Gigaspora margarita]